MRTLIALLVFTVAGFGQTYTEQLANYLSSGYRFKVNQNRVLIYSPTDTVKWRADDIPKKEMRIIMRAEQEFRKLEREYNRRIAQILKTRVGNEQPKPVTVRFYAISDNTRRNKRIISRVFGADSLYLEHVRMNKDSTEFVFQARIPEADTTKIIERYQDGTIKMPTWKYFTVDSLRKYINSPAWTDTTGRF
jgi:hypothetical protein